MFFTIHNIRLHPFPVFYLQHHLKTFVNHRPGSCEALLATAQHILHIHRHPSQRLVFRLLHYLTKNKSFFQRLGAENLTIWLRITQKILRQSFFGQMYSDRRIYTLSNIRIF